MNFVKLEVLIFYSSMCDLLDFFLIISNIFQKVEKHSVIDRYAVLLVEFVVVQC